MAESEDRLPDPSPLAIPTHPALALIGAACQLGMAQSRCDEAPEFLRRHLAANPSLRGQYVWHRMLSARPLQTTDFPPPGLAPFSRRLAKAVSECVAQQRRFMVFGGDHAVAIGTWSGAARGLREYGGHSHIDHAGHGDHRSNLGLVWIDAHMDAHTASTSPSGRAHGMPVATLLGAGDPALEFFGRDHPAALKPENLCLVGVRSFESEEAALLERLGARIYLMSEVQRRGLKIVMREALEQVSARTAGFGVSLDLDSIDPRDAPGVTTAVTGGLRSRELLPLLREACADNRFIGMEVAEFNPADDRDGRTAALIEKLVAVAATAPK